jgi:hypothetical protein
MSKSLCLQPNNLAETFLNLDAIRQLIREELGCDCPEVDLKKDEHELKTHLEPEEADRCMEGQQCVSLVPVDHLQDVAKDARDLLSDGKGIRDRHGLNRYRLVLVGHVSREVIGDLQKEAQGIDDRMHVHLIEPDRLIS